MTSIHSSVERYYSAKLKTHGRTPRGVDWNSSQSQGLRFEQLSRVVDFNLPFSIIDYGCGYGALIDYLESKNGKFQYVGFDLSGEMISSAREAYGERSNCIFTTDAKSLKPTDYVIASGIFSVQLETPDEDWLNYILDTLKHMNSVSTKGFAFNALTLYSDAENMRKDLYYADPALVFDFCKRNFSKRVALLHDYPLYEFTILVRK